MSGGFFSTYAALRLAGPRRKTLTGQAARGLFKVALAPIAAAGALTEVAVKAAIRQRKLEEAEAKLAANQAAAAERRAASRTQAGSFADLRRQMGERP